MVERDKDQYTFDSLSGTDKGQYTFDHLSGNDKDQYTIDVLSVKNKDQYTIDILSAMAERTIKRLWILVILLVVLLFGSNAAWIYYESQWEVVETTEVTQENEGGYNNYVGRDGEIVNGETNHQNDQKSAQKNWG